MNDDLKYTVYSYLPLWPVEWGKNGKKGAILVIIILEMIFHSIGSNLVSL